MRKVMSYKTTRALQICIVFAATLIVQVFFGYAKAAWTGFAVMMIYAGFDAGAAMQRTFHRFWGALFGLLLSYVLWFIGHVDYRLLVIIIPFVVFMAYFTLGKLYAVPTVFTVTLTALGTDYYSNNTYFVAWFFSDYFICTVIALIICVVFEFFGFKKSNLTRKFFVDLQQEIVLGLSDLLKIVTHSSLNRSLFLKATVKLNQKVLDMNNFIITAHHDYHTHDGLLDEVDNFSDGIKLAYNNVRKLFILFTEKNVVRYMQTPNTIKTAAEYETIKQETVELINRLGSLSNMKNLHLEDIK